MFPQSYIVKCSKSGFDHPLTLDELFTLFKEIYPKSTDYELVGKIRIDIGKLAYCSNYCNTLSIHEIYLLAFYFTKYKKEWNTRTNNWR